MRARERVSRILSRIGTDDDPVTLEAFIKDELEDFAKENEIEVVPPSAPATGELDDLRYQTIAELTTDWIYIARKEADGGSSLLWVTAGFERSTGYTLDELKQRGMSYLELVNAEERQRVRMRHRTSSASNTVEYRLHTKAGDELWLRDHAHIQTNGSACKAVHVLGAVKNITQEKHKEEALRDALLQLEQRTGMELARFRAVLNQAGEAIFVVDAKSAEVVDVNETACRSLGSPRIELIGMRLDRLMDAAPAWAVPGGALSLRGPAISQEGKHRRHNGELFPVEWTVSRQRFLGQDYLLVVARETSERKQMEAQLAQSDRLATVGILAAGVAHEVNNPLAYILNNISFVMARLNQEQRELYEALREARLGAERVRDIVKDLKTFSRPDDPKIQPVDVCSLLDAAIKVAHNEIRHRAQLIRKYDKVPVVKASSRLGQVFLNLLLNAAHAIDKGDSKSNSITVHVESIGDEVGVHIIDTGVGIPEADQLKIFDAFYTTKPVGVGTGLGLSICTSITNSFGGRIEVRSQLGEGSTFSVWLPAARHARLPQPRLSSVPPPEASSSLRILVIDDDAFVARSVRRLLSHQHEVEIALSGREALQTLDRASFDLVFCDVMMPGMTGLDLYHQVCTRDPSLARRFVFITGGPFTPEAQAQVDAVSSPCLQKPFTPQALALVLESIAGNPTIPTIPPPPPTPWDST